MPQTDSHVGQNEASHANGGSTMHDLFVLTDEQILEIEPEAQDVQVSNGQLPASRHESPNVAPASLPAGSDTAPQNENRRLEAAATQAQPGAAHDAQPGLAVPQAPPAWLAAQMKDPWTGQEAQELWNGVQQAKSEAAAYRAAFATPEDARAVKELYPGGVNEARATAERARTLDDIDRAYFGGAGNSPEQISAARAQLAQTMLREDPAAFREMVFAGLRALEASENGSRDLAVAANHADLSVAAPFRAPSLSVNAQPQANQSELKPAATQTLHEERIAAQEAQVAAYAAFEKAANADLERSVGATITRTLEQALPSLSRDGQTSVVGAQHPDGIGTGAAPLQARLSQAIRQDVEAALKGDRQLGEQIAQILSARRFDNETRAQVVRLIGERAQQLVPSATKRVLNEWTQTTLAAHRGQSQRADAASARREVAPARTDSRGATSQAGASASSSRDRSQDPNRSAARSDPRRVDYRKLSDEQILDL